MNELKEFMPIIIPLIAAQFALLIYAIVHILTHKNYKRGNRTMWLIIAIVGMQFVGPILYIVLGKEES